MSDITKISHIFHISHDDMDGVGAVIVAEKYYREHPTLAGHTVQYTPIKANYNTIVPAMNGILESGLAPQDFVLVTDVSFPEDFVPTIRHAMAHENLNIAVIDHHISTEWMKDEPWAMHDVNACGTKLTAQYFAMMDEPLVHQFANTVDAYDRWLRDHPLRQAGVNLNSIFKFLGWELFRQRGIQVNLSDSERYVLAVQDTRDNDKIQEVLDSDLFIVDVYIPELERFLKAAVFINAHMPYGQVADAILQSGRAEMMVSFNTNSDRTVTINSHLFDVAAYCEAHGGGGHPTIGGFTIDPDDLYNPCLALDAALLRAKGTMSHKMPVNDDPEVE